MICKYQDKCKKFIEGTCPEEGEYCIKKDKLDRYISLSNLPSCALDSIKWVYNEEDKEAFNHLKNIQDNIVEFVNSGSNLYLCSTHCGNGKSTWSYKLGLAYIDKLWKRSEIRTLVYFVNVSDLLTTIKESFDNPDKNDKVESIKNSILESDLTIWDDFGVKQLSEFDRSFLLELIDYRINNHKANIYTSNNLEGLTLTKYGDRLRSRVYMLSQIIELQGEDMRGIKNGWSNTNSK